MKFWSTSINMISSLSGYYERREFQPQQKCDLEMDTILKTAFISRASKIQIEHVNFLSRSCYSLLFDSWMVGRVRSQSPLLHVPVECNCEGKTPPHKHMATTIARNQRILPFVCMLWERFSQGKSGTVEYRRCSQFMEDKQS